MTLVIPTACAHVIHSLRWDGDPELMAITYGVDEPLAGPTEDANDMASQLRAAFVTNMIPRLSNAIHLVNTEVKIRTGAGPTDFTIGIDSTVADGSSGATTLLPQNSAYLVHKRSTTSGTSGRGRMYFPGVDDSSVDNLGAISTLVKNSWNTSLTAWLAAIDAAAQVGSMVVLHDSAGAHAADPPRPVTTLTIDPVIATQRRRLRK